MKRAAAASFRAKLDESCRKPATAFSPASSLCRESRAAAAFEAAHCVLPQSNYSVPRRGDTEMDDRNRGQQQGGGMEQGGNQGQGEGQKKPSQGQGGQNQSGQNQGQNQGQGGQNQGGQ